MAKVGIDLPGLCAEAGYVPASLVPETAYTGRLARRTRSVRLTAYRACMHDLLAGRQFRSGSALTDLVAVQTAFREAAHTCAQRDKVYPSNRRAAGLHR